MSKDASHLSLAPEQCLRARELLGWSSHRLARQAGVNAKTVPSLETGQARPRPPTISAIRSALEEAGVQFLADGRVRLGERRADAS